MNNWITPVTEAEQNDLTTGIESAIAKYHRERDYPRPYTPPQIEAQPPRPFPVQTAVKVGVVISGTAIAVVSVVAACKAIAVGVATFAAANAFIIGAVAVCGVLLGVGWAIVANGEHVGNVHTTTGNTEEQQTIININVATGGGRVEVNK